MVTFQHYFRYIVEVSFIGGQDPLFVIIGVYTLLNYYFMKGKFKQWWSIIPSISTK